MTDKLNRLTEQIEDDLCLLMQYLQEAMRDLPAECRENEEELLERTSSFHGAIIDYRDNARSTDSLQN